MTGASRVMKARWPGTCGLCHRAWTIGQQIGKTPVGWCHVTCIIKAAKKIAGVSKPGMMRIKPPR